MGDAVVVAGGGASAVLRDVSVDPRLPMLSGDLALNCKALSLACSGALSRAKASPQLLAAARLFASANEACVRNSTAPCVRHVDAKHWHWRSNICAVRCEAGREALAVACGRPSALGSGGSGVLADWRLFLGLGGTTLEAVEPVCVPELCAEELERLGDCFARATCGRVPAQVLPECRSELASVHALSRQAVERVFVIALLSALALAVGLVGARRFAAARRRWATAAAARAQAQASGLSQPFLAHDFGIVEGTPRVFDERLLVEDDEAAVGATPDVYFSGGAGAGQTRLSPAPGPSPLSGLSVPGALSALASAPPLGGGGGGPGAPASAGLLRSGSASSRRSSSGGDLLAGGGAAPGPGSGPGPALAVPAPSVKFRLNEELESHVLEGLRARLEQRGGGSTQGLRRDCDETLVWHNLFYRKEGVLVLRGLTGLIKPGTMVAVVGAPDSGATTLLKVLAGRATGGDRWGDVLLGGRPPNRAFHRKVGYIPKEDLNLPSLTVRETLAFSLALRSDRSLSPRMREDRVDAALQLLGLTHCADTIVGDNLTRGVSGGEKRRVSIGVEAIVGRKFVIMDCVTNGLDSAAAYEVIKASRVMADSRLNCSIATVRQPSTALLQLFHKVCLLSRGSCIYFGPTAGVEGYLARLGFTRPLAKALPDFLEELTGDASAFTISFSGRGGLHGPAGSQAPGNPPLGGPAASDGAGQRPGKVSPLSLGRSAGAAQPRWASAAISPPRGGSLVGGHGGPRVVPLAGSAGQLQQLAQEQQQQQQQQQHQQEQQPRPPRHGVEDSGFFLNPNPGRRRLKRVASRLRLGLVASFKQSKEYDELGRRIWQELDKVPVAEGGGDAESGEGEGEGEEDLRAVLRAAGLGSGGLLQRLREMSRAAGDWFSTAVLENWRYESSFLVQLRVCISRQVKITVRSPTLRTKLIRAVIQGVNFGTMFGVMSLDQRGMRNRYGLLFLVVTAVPMGALAVIPQLFYQRVIYYHQRAAGYFRPAAYLASVVLCELPAEVAEALIFATLVYPLCGLADGLFSERWLFLVATHALLNLAAFSLCLLGVMAAPSAVVATSAVPTLLSLQVLISGYLVRRDKLPWPNIVDLSMIAAPMKALALNEMDGLVFRCDDDELVPPIGSANATLPPPDGFWGPEYRTCPIPTGHLSLYLYGYEEGEQDKWVLLLQLAKFIAAHLLLVSLAVTVCNYAPDSSDSAVTALQSLKRMRALERLARLDKEREAGERRAARAAQRRAGGSDDDSDADGAEASPYDAEEDGGGAGVIASSSSCTGNGNGNGSGSGNGALLALPLPRRRSSAASAGSAALGAGSGSVEFSGLNYSVSISRGVCRKAEVKQLLFGIEGHVSGQILALMGPSGSGKSTLLDVLAARKTGGTISSDSLLFNGRPRDRYFARLAGYVEQMDSHLPTTTVLEAIVISAELRLPASLPRADKLARVTEVIDCLGLRPFERAQIGTPDQPGKSVSPEVRKKVTIGVELVVDFDILFLDEPTTGLDARSALSIMQAIRRTCARKSTICTIHQPSAEVFALFDSMLLLQTGGRVAYFGPVARMKDYFARNGFGACGPDTNPADYALECTRQSIGAQDAAGVFAASEMRAEMAALAPSAQQQRLQQHPQHLQQQQGGQPAPGASSPSFSTFTSTHAAPWWTQLRVQVATQFHYIARDSAVTYTRYVTALLFALIIAWLFYGIDRSQASAQSRIGLIFISVIYPAYVGIQTIPKQVDQRPVRFREHGSNYYYMWVHFLAQIVTELPFLFVQIALFVGTFYQLVGLRSGWHFWFYLAVLLLHGTTAFGVSQLIASLAANADVATIVNTVVNGVMSLLSGYLIPFETIPPFWRVFYYVAFYRFPLGSLASNELLGAEFDCGPFNNESALPIFVGGDSALAPPPPYGNGNFSGQCLQAIKEHARAPQELLGNKFCFNYYCPITTGDYLLDRFAFPMTWDHVFSQALWLFIYALAFRVLAFVAMSSVQHVSR